MSRKLIAEEQDVLGETHLPEDLFTSTEGLNWGMDGYPDLAYGAGVLDGSELWGSPTSTPDGIVVASSEHEGMEDSEWDNSGVSFDNGGDFPDDMLVEASDITDLSWLEFAEQDPERLPENPVDLMIPELEEAWDWSQGAHREAAVDREAAAYEASLENETPAPMDKTAKLEMLHLIRHAWRQVTAGTSSKTALTELATRLGERAPMVLPAAKMIQADAGLIGKVFIRASNYPGCESGKWTEPVRQVASNAKYLVADTKCSNCVYAQNGSCAVFKKKIVAEVPWKEAAALYKPVLDGTGRVLNASLDPKLALKLALNSASVGQTVLGDHRPEHKVLADQITTEATRKAFDATPMPVASIMDMSRTDMQKRLVSWKSSGLLTPAQTERLTQSTAAPHAVLKAAAGIINVVKQGAYSGGMNAGKMGYDADMKTVMAQLAQAEEHAKQAQDFLHAEIARRDFTASVEGRRIAKIETQASKVRQSIDNGLCGRALVAAFIRAFDVSERGLAHTILDPYIQQKNALAERATQNTTYTGVGVRSAKDKTVSASDAWAHVRAHNLPSAIDLQARFTRQAREKLSAQLGRWVRDGMLEKSVAERLARSTAPTQEVLRIAAAVIGQAKISAYSGGYSNTHASAQVAPLPLSQAWVMLSAAEANNVAGQHRVDASLNQKRSNKIAAGAQQIKNAVSKGLRGQSLINMIRTVFAKDELREASKLLNPILKSSGALSTDPSIPRSYADTTYTRAPTPVHQASAPLPQEVTRLLKWARLQMTEGSLGRELDQLIAGRFASTVRTAGQKALQDVRSAHEGLSGHVYVDAAVYASKEGTTGCEAGALKHRANNIPTVMEMPKCGSCTKRQAKADGTPICSLYNKELVASVPVENPRAMQAQHIRSANATDHERTAALFANKYDAFEYNLQGNPDAMTIEDLPEDGELGDILFDGNSSESGDTDGDALSIGGMTWE